MFPQESYLCNPHLELFFKLLQLLLVDKIRNACMRFYGNRYGNDGKTSGDGVLWLYRT